MTSLFFAHRVSEHSHTQDTQEPTMTKQHRAGWTFAVVSLGLFMITLDNLIVTTALPSIRRDLDASLGALEWTINAYTLSFAVLLLPAAALGDRFGRKRMFLGGLALFTAASGLAALAPSAGAPVARPAPPGGRGGGLARRCPRRPGRRRRGHRPPEPHAPRRRRACRQARPRARRVVGRERHGR